MRAKCVWCGGDVNIGVDIDVDIYVNRKRKLYFWHVACTDHDPSYQEYRNAILADYRAFKDPDVCIKLYNAIMLRDHYFVNLSQDKIAVASIKSKDGKEMTATITPKGKVNITSTIEPNLLKRWLVLMIQEVA